MYVRMYVYRMCFVNVYMIVVTLLFSWMSRTMSITHVHLKVVFDETTYQNGLALVYI